MFNSLVLLLILYLNILHSAKIDANLIAAQLIVQISMMRSQIIRPIQHLSSGVGQKIEYKFKLAFLIHKYMN